MDSRMIQSFSQNHYNITEEFDSHNDALITICDTADGKQAARKRLFDSWFNKYNNDFLIKLDTLVDLEDETTFASLLFTSDNINAEELIHNFKELSKANFYN